MSAFRTSWLGPVHDAEQKQRARRWQGYAVRSCFVLALLAGVALVWSGRGRSRSTRWQGSGRRCIRYWW